MMAVLAVLMKAGRRMNRILRRIWDQVPGLRERSFHDRQMGINRRLLLPVGHSDFSCVGSLTEPSCTEAVQWFVPASALVFDNGNLRRFLDVRRANARPVQQINGRLLLAAFRRWASLGRRLSG